MATIPSAVWTPKVYILTNPETVGDFANRILIDRLQLYSISLTAGDANPVLSIVLLHPTSGYQENFVYRDATVLPFWAQINSSGGIESAVFQKLVADGKLPAGAMA